MSRIFKIKRSWRLKTRNKSDANSIIELEEKLRNLKEKKKNLIKTISELKYDSHFIGKQLEKAENDIEDSNDAETLMYKLKALKKKKELIIAANVKHQNVMAKINQRIENAHEKVIKEQKKVDNAERRNLETISHKEESEIEQSDQEDYATNVEDQKIQKYTKTYVSLKREGKDKKLELEKLFIELHERDKENRLLKLKMKELERMVPQHRLNPMAKGKIGNIINRRKKMKNSSIYNANNSVLVTKKEHSLKQIKGKNYLSNPGGGKVKRVDSRKKVISEVNRPGNDKKENRK